MFGLGFWEIVIVLLVVFLVVKPEDLPRFFRKLGKLYQQVTSFSRGIKRMMNQAESVVKNPLSHLEPKKTPGMKSQTQTPVPPVVEGKDKDDNQTSI